MKCFLLITVHLLTCFYILEAQELERGVKPVNKDSRKNYNKTKAVIIGISDYKHINKLQYASADASEIAKTFKTLNLIQEKDISLLLDSEANKFNIKRAMYNTLKMANPNDHVIIYFAGHGDANNPDSSLIDYSGYLLCHGVTNSTDYELDEAIKINTLKGWINGATNKNIFVTLIIDACRSGMFVSSRKETIKSTLTSLTKMWDNSVNLISCQPDQFSFEGQNWGGGHGVFTYYLLDALKKDELREDYTLRIYDIFNHIEKNTTADTDRKQIPLSTGNPNFVLFNFQKEVNNISSDSITISTPIFDESISNDSLRNLLEKFEKAISRKHYLAKNDENSAYKILQEIIKIAPENVINEKRALFNSRLFSEIDSTILQINAGFYYQFSIDHLKKVIEFTEILMDDQGLIPNDKIDLEVKRDFLKSFLKIKEGKKGRKKALRTLHKIKNNREHSAFAYNSIGLFYKIENNYDSAIYYFSKAENLAINWYIPKLFLGETYSYTGDKEKSLEKINEAFALKESTNPNRNFDRFVAEFGISNLLDKGLADFDRKTFKDKAWSKIKELGDYFMIISNKNTNFKKSNEAIDAALKLFLNEDAIVEVSSANRSEVQKYKPRKYFERLKLLKYSKIKITWSNISYVSDIKKGGSVLKVRMEFLKKRQCGGIL